MYTQAISLAGVGVGRGNTDGAASFYYGEKAFLAFRVRLGSGVIERELKPLGGVAEGGKVVDFTNTNEHA